MLAKLLFSIFLSISWSCHALKTLSIFDGYLYEVYEPQDVISGQLLETGLEID